MNKEKQIEEMTEILCTHYHKGKCTIDDFDCGDGFCTKRERMYDLYNAGYRKADEVAREFIEAVDSMMECITAMTGLSLTYYGKYAELKKKYTESENNK